MLISEFISRTGFMPTSDEYSALEKLYYDWDGDKDDFCAHFVKNKDAMLTKAREIACASFEEERARLLQNMHAAQNECERLKQSHKIELLTIERDHARQMQEAEDYKRSAKNVVQAKQDTIERLNARVLELERENVELRSNVDALRSVVKLIKE